MMKKVLLGIISGLICGIFASGGGLILVPAYVYILHMDDVKARATSVFSILPMESLSLNSFAAAYVTMPSKDIFVSSFCISWYNRYIL